MFIRKSALVAVVATLGLLIVGSVSASASVALRTDPGGGRLTGATTITNTISDPATLFLDGLGVVSCSQASFTGHFTSNNNASVIAGTVGSLTFTSCTDTLPVITIPSCTLNPGTAPAVSITTNRDTGGNATLVDPVVRCSIAGTMSSFCYYTGTNVIGQGFNATSNLHFSDAPIDHVTGPGDLAGACGTTGNFGVTLTHIVQVGTNRTITITTT
jgi:hypothetical protein